MYKQAKTAGSVAFDKMQIMRENSNTQGTNGVNATVAYDEMNGA